MKPEFTVCVYFADESESSFCMASPSFKSPQKIPSKSQGKPDKKSSTRKPDKRSATKEVRQKKQFQTIYRKSQRSLVGRTKNTEVESDQSESEDESEDESEEENAPEGNAPEGNAPKGNASEGNDTAGDKLKKKGKSEKKEDPIHYNGIDIREDVYQMTEIPLDFYYKKVPKPPNKGEPPNQGEPEDWLVMEATETVWIQKSDQPRTKFALEVYDNFKHVEDLKATTVYREIKKDPSLFRFMELTEADQKKIAKNIDKFPNVIDKDFNFVEIIRCPTEERPNPFTGDYIFFSKHLKLSFLIGIFNHFSK